ETRHARRAPPRGEVLPWLQTRELSLETQRSSRRSQPDLRRLCGPSAASPSVLLGRASPDALPAVLGGFLHLSHPATESLGRASAPTSSERTFAPGAESRPFGRRRRRSGAWPART